MVLLGIACERAPSRPILKLLEASKSCRVLPDSDGLQECVYSADRLRISVIGIGAIASIGIDGSDEQDGYGVAVFLENGCVRVAPGTQMKVDDPMRRTEDAFISTWDGEIYESSVYCMMAAEDARHAAEARSTEQRPPRPPQPANSGGG